MPENPDDNQTSKAIYGTGVFTGAKTTKRKLGEADSILSVMKYDWLISCKRDEFERKFEISAKLRSRYVFSDKLILKIILENDEDKVHKEEFNLEKRTGVQIFTVDFNKVGYFIKKKVEKSSWIIFIYASVENEEVNYITDDWATEINFKDNLRAHDVVLVVADRKFYVHRNYLATWSRFFDRLFFGNFKEKDQKEVKHEDVDADEFELLLRFMHPQLCWDIDEENVLGTLKLADRFEIPNIMSRCGKFLCDFDNCKDMSLIDRLELADKHNLVHLQVACLKRVHQMPAQERINFCDENRDRILNLSPMTVKNLI